MENFLYTHGTIIGYILLFLGSFVEGEIILLAAGFLAYAGFFYFPFVVLIAFLGTLTSDQTWFFSGRLYGPGVIEKRPKWKQKAEIVFAELNKHPILFILCFRFIYGIRTISPLIIGASGFSIFLFILLDVIAALTWAIVVTLIGYTLGYYLAGNLVKLKGLLDIYQASIIILIAIVITALVSYIKYRK